MQRHVGRVVGRREGVVEGAPRQIRDDGRVGDRGSANGHGES